MGPEAVAAFCFFKVSPADLDLRGDCDLLFEDVLDVDLAGECDLLLMLLLEPNKLRYCCVGTAREKEKERMRQKL